MYIGRQGIKMATLHLMVGLPGSGKTTEAIRLEQEYHALRLTPDEWHLHLFGHDFREGSDNAEHDRRHTLVEELMWDTAQKVLRLGVNVILDFGCWARVERDAFRQKAHALGADFQIHYMACPVETLWERIQERNKLADEKPVFRISREQLEAWSRQFEPPTVDELSR